MCRPSLRHRISAEAARSTTTIAQSLARYADCTASCQSSCAAQTNVKTSQGKIFERIAALAEHCNAYN